MTNRNFASHGASTYAECIHLDVWIRRQRRILHLAVEVQVGQRHRNANCAPRYPDEHAILVSREAERHWTGFVERNVARQAVEVQAAPLKGDLELPLTGRILHGKPQQR